MTNKVILVVDDDISVLETIDYLLTSNGYNIMLAANGEDGLAIIKSQWIDVIILDLKMPKMSGYMLATLINKHSLNKNIRIMLLTGQALLAGGCNLSVPNVVCKLSKPFEPSELVQTVDVLLHQKKPIPLTIH